MCTSSTRAGEYPNMIIYSGGKSSTVPRAGIHTGTGSYIKFHVMRIRGFRGRSHDCQGVLAVLQQGSPVKRYVKHSTGIRSIRLKKICQWRRYCSNVITNINTNIIFYFRSIHSDFSYATGKYAPA